MMLRALGTSSPTRSPTKQSPQIFFGNKEKPSESLQRASNEIIRSHANKALDSTAILLQYRIGNT